MRPLRAPKHSLEEDEILQELAEIETRLKQAESPANTFEVRRRSFYEALARMWRQRLMLLKTGVASQETPAEPEPAPPSEPGADRRQMPRTETDVDAQMISSDGRVGPAQVLNVSRGGLAISFDRNTLRTVFPDNQVLPGTVLSVRFQPQETDSSWQTVQATGVVVWVQQVHEDQYRLGLRWG